MAVTVFVLKVRVQFTSKIEKLTSSNVLIQSPALFAGVSPSTTRLKAYGATTGFASSEVNRGCTTADGTSPASEGLGRMFAQPMKPFVITRWV